jgi:uncharacterized membrane protein (UPF0127 family)
MPVMTDKKNIKKKNKAIHSRKISFSRLILIIFAVIIAAAFLFFSLYSPKKSKPTKRPSSTGSITAPSFRKDGSLTILRSQNSIPVNIDIEIADEEHERMQGLMYRYSMAENNGMLFIFPKEEPRSFWMKNTYISLDIIYINSSKKIVSIQKYTQPQTTYSIPSEKPASYVLEVNAGFTDKYGIKPGDKIEFTFNNHG